MATKTEQLKEKSSGAQLEVLDQLIKEWKGDKTAPIVPKRVGQTEEERKRRQRLLNISGGTGKEALTNIRGVIGEAGSAVGRSRALADLAASGTPTTSDIMSAGVIGIQSPTTQAQIQQLQSDVRSNVGNVLGATLSSLADTEGVSGARRSSGASLERGVAKGAAVSSMADAIGRGTTAITSRAAERAQDIAQAQGAQDVQTKLAAAGTQLGAAGATQNMMGVISSLPTMERDLITTELAAAGMMRQDAQLDEQYKALVERSKQNPVLARALKYLPAIQSLGSQGTNAQPSTPSMKSEDYIRTLLPIGVDWLLNR